MAREAEADRRPVAAPSLSFTPTSGAQFTGNIISSKLILNVTVAGAFSFRTLDGVTTSLGTLPIGVYVFDIQCDLLTWGGTMSIAVLYNLS